MKSWTLRRSAAFGSQIRWSVERAQGPLICLAEDEQPGRCRSRRRRRRSGSRQSLPRSSAFPHPTTYPTPHQFPNWGLVGHTPPHSISASPSQLPTPGREHAALALMDGESVARAFEGSINLKARPHRCQSVRSLADWSISQWWPLVGRRFVLKLTDDGSGLACPRYPFGHSCDADLQADESIRALESASDTYAGCVVRARRIQSSGPSDPRLANFDCPSPEDRNQNIAHSKRTAASSVCPSHTIAGASCPACEAMEMASSDSSDSSVD